jgi:A/G-specific adenine glycosylase
MSDINSIAPTSSEVSLIRRRLLRWYDRYRRDLPWRSRTADPYAQWVAEIMLQQTRVDTVIAYYERFLRRFPDVTVLARANHDEVLKYWEGLGYYRRIDNLHRAACQLYEANQEIPQTADALAKLPGIGTYTSAAIASIAFGERVAAVDGNVSRVIARLMDVRHDVLSTAGKRRVQHLADLLISAERPGDFNQAWMDLGGMICTPKSPVCGRCPLATVCVARAAGLAHELPIRCANGRRPPTNVKLAVGVFLLGGKVLIRQRPQGGLWSGLWEFPAAELKGQASATRAVRNLASRAGLRLSGRLRRVATIERRLTHRAVTFLVYVGRLESFDARANGTTHRWVSAKRKTKLSMSSAHQQIWKAVHKLVKTCQGVRDTFGG